MPNSHEKFPLDPTAPFKINQEGVLSFERPGFKGFTQVMQEQGLGFSALTILVHGEHPTKRMLHGTRTYYVANSDPQGTFTLGQETHEVKEGDLFVIPEGGEYSYRGDMTLFEVNVASADGVIMDELVDQ